MPGVSRVKVDSAGGKITGNLAPTVFVNNKPIAVKGARVVSHGNDEHSGGPVMVGSSSTVFANKKKVCRKGDAASCGHKATGSQNVFAGK
jgi:uncharacterized Zn-binding protein involved in type VI secretion